MQLLDAIKSAFSATSQKQQAQQAETGIVVGPVKRVVGEFPQPTFLQLYNYYLSDPTIHNAVNTFRDRMVGSGFYVTGDDQNAVGIINDFVKGVDFDILLYDIVGDMLITGISLVEMLTPDNLQDLEMVQMSTILKIQRDKFGNYTNIVQLVEGIYNNLNPTNFIQFRLFDVGRNAFPVGLFYSLAVPQLIDGEVRPSVLDSLARIRDAMVRIFDNYASPRDMYVFENASEQFLQDQAVKIRNMKKGESFVTNKKFDHMEITIDPRSRFDNYIEFFKMQVELGIQSGIIKLQSAHDYTYASATAVQELLDMRAAGMQKRLARTIEHVHNLEHFAKELFRVMKDGGKTWIVTPDSPKDERNLYDVNMKKFSEWKKFFSKYGFIVKKQKQYGFMDLKGKAAPLRLYKLPEPLLTWVKYAIYWYLNRTIKRKSKGQEASFMLIKYNHPQ